MDRQSYVVVLACAALLAVGPVSCRRESPKVPDGAADFQQPAAEPEPQPTPLPGPDTPSAHGGLLACTDRSGRTPIDLLAAFAQEYANAPAIVRDSAFHALWSSWHDIAGRCMVGDSLTNEVWSEDSSRGRAVTAAFAAAGYDWGNAEGEVFLVPRVATALQYAGDIVSPVVRKYLELSDVTRYPQLYNDAGIVIDYKDLADRVFLWADTALHQPSCVFRDEAGQELQMYMTALLSGADNTRVFWEEPETDGLRVDEAFVIAYEYVVEKYGDHPLAQIVQEYLALITAPGFDAKRDLPAFERKYPEYCRFGLYTR